MEQMNLDEMQIRIDEISSQLKRLEGGSVSADIAEIKETLKSMKPKEKTFLDKMFEQKKRRRK